jgi:hypothetical protein
MLCLYLPTLVYPVLVPVINPLKMTLVESVYENSVCTLQRTLSLTIIKMKHITLCGQKAHIACT